MLAHQIAMENPSMVLAEGAVPEQNMLAELIRVLGK